MKFDLLVQNIQDTHVALQQSAVKAINRHITIRNWLIGLYIVEYEQKGEDRAKYGDRLLIEIANRIEIKGVGDTMLKLFRRFYLAYPQILQSLSAISPIGQSLIDQFHSIDIQGIEIGQTVSAQSGPNPKQQITIGQTASDQLQKNDIQNITIGQSLTGQSQSADQELMVPPEKLISRLSFSHLVELLPISDPLKRTFYELESMKGNWSVRELRRQIDSLYYERSGMSAKPEKLSAMVAEKAEPLNPADIVRNVYAFEFLGLKAKDIIEETDLETALLDHLQEFLLEMGHGFCLEARQKRILIGDEYFFVDLVFYHRVLKCHVLVDLKVEAFDHTNAGQLNTYLNYYKKEIALPDDNPPVGILLVTNKNDALVEYAIAGMDNKLFVSKYLVELPGKKQLEDFVKQELKRL